DIALGAPADRAKDTLGRVYEYFLAQFASAEGKRGGQFYTPSHVVRVLVEMLAPFKGRVYDPCCGSGGMFVQSEKLLKPTPASLATFGPRARRAPTLRPAAPGGLPTIGNLMAITPPAARRTTQKIAPFPWAQRRRSRGRAAAVARRGPNE